MGKPDGRSCVYLSQTAELILLKLLRNFGIIDRSMNLKTEKEQ